MPAKLASFWKGISFWSSYLRRMSILPLRIIRRYIQANILCTYKLLKAGINCCPHSFSMPDASIVQGEAKLQLLLAIERDIEMFTSQTTQTTLSYIQVSTVWGQLCLRSLGPGAFVHPFLSSFPTCSWSKLLMLSVEYVVFWHLILQCRQDLYSPWQGNIEREQYYKNRVT